AAGSSQGWVSIFNGRDLAGWDGDPRFWSVKDGAIRGETTPGNPTRGNTFIVWRDGELKDFELKIKFRLLSGNSGVQYRSKEVDKWVIGGYQAEVINNPEMAGFLYHERGRGWLVNVGDLMVIDENGGKEVISNVSDAKELIKAGFYKEEDWNEYYIIAQGNHLVHYLNGYQTMELIDNDRVTNPSDPKDLRGAARQGLLALQLHAGDPMIVEFKDIRVKHLDEKYGDAQLIFNGENLNEWQVKGDNQKSKWAVGKAKVSPRNPKQLVAEKGRGEMINVAAKHGDSIDIFSKAKFGDCRIELQVMVPQGSNSGIYVMGEYEIQVLDSWGRQKMTGGDMGAVYGASPPKVNASKKPGQWQKYIIDFQAPKFDSSKKKTDTAKLLKVELNGKTLHKKDLVMKKETPGGVIGKEEPPGPLMFQGNHGPVAYRNIIIKPLAK
ncbi:MAG: 3-keto-disaccharide hydrolase, partial [Planctomycetota bacterium]